MNKSTISISSFNYLFKILITASLGSYPKYSGLIKKNVLHFQNPTEIFIFKVSDIRKRDQNFVQKLENVIWDFYELMWSEIFGSIEEVKKVNGFSSWLPMNELSLDDEGQDNGQDEDESEDEGSNAMSNAGSSKETRATKQEQEEFFVCNQSVYEYATYILNSILGDVLPFPNSVGRFFREENKKIIFTCPFHLQNQVEVKGSDLLQFVDQKTSDIDVPGFSNFLKKQFQELSKNEIKLPEIDPDNQHRFRYAIVRNRTQ